ncbi:MAG: competence/damage-inducible protein A [Acidimicrobiales bacterium]
MRTEIVAVGTELLLGQIVDTNSTWIAEQLAESGIDCTMQVRVGDNVERVAAALRDALERAEAVIVSGGLGPTQDDLTREAIAEVMGVDLVENQTAMALVEEAFATRGRVMSPSNRRQGFVPAGATLIEQRLGSAPGLICPVGDKVIYALPGVPDELEEMTLRAVLPDLRSRRSEDAVILSRIIKTWGIGESRLSELVAERVDALDRSGPGAPTIAFLARGVEGVQVRVTVKASDARAAASVLDEEQKAIEAILGDSVFGFDDETMESRVGALLVAKRRSLAVAESFTGGLIASRIVAVPGASRWFRGSVVAYAKEAKRDVLGLEDGPVVSSKAAAEMARGAIALFGADVAVATTGVAGPDPQEGHPPGTAFVGIAFAGGGADAEPLELFGTRKRIRELGAISALDRLRRRLVNDA